MGEKQLEYLKLPLYKPTPKSARNKKFLPPINSEERNSEAMNTSRYVCLPDLDSTDEEEEEKDPMVKLSRKERIDGSLSLRRSHERLRIDQLEQSIVQIGV